jgi:hypothetical protein
MVETKEAYQKKMKRQAEKQLKSGVMSIVLWTAKRERYPTLQGHLLPLAKDLETIGLLKFPKEQRQILLEKALGILNFVEARAKTRMFSVKELLQSSNKIYRNIMKQKKQETTKE